MSLRMDDKKVPKSGMLKQIKRTQKEKKQINKLQREKNNKKQGSFAKYSICMLVLAGLIAVSFMGPQLVFVMQDKYYINNIQLSERSSMDMEALDATYEEDLQKRLQKFSDGLDKGKTYFATETTYQMNDEFGEILDTVLAQEWARIMEETGVMPLNYYIYKSGFDLTCWKRYIIYDKEFEDGVIFMAWYMDLELADGQRLQLLVDTEDYALYFIRLQVTDAELSDAELWDYINEAFVYEYASYWYYYYNGEITEEDKVSYYVEGSSNAAVVEFEEENEVNVVRTKVGEDGESIICEVDLPYRWLLGIDKDAEEKSFAFYFGIAEIGELIPEIEEEMP